MAVDPLDPINCACFNTRRAARRITQAYDRAMRPAGLQATQFTVLATLKGGSRAGIPMTVLAGRLGMDRTTLTRNLGLIERRGWAATVPGADRRERLVRLTPAGRRKLLDAMPYWQKAQQAVLGLLGSDGLGTLLDLTRKLDTG